MLVTVSMDRTVRVWSSSARDGAASVLSTVGCAGGFVYAAAANPDDPATLAIGLGDKTLRLVDSTSLEGDAVSVGVSAGRVAQRRRPPSSTTIWRGIDGRVTALAWHPTSLRGVLAFGTDSGSVGLCGTHDGSVAVLAGRGSGDVVAVTWIRLEAVWWIAALTASGDLLVQPDPSEPSDGVSRETADPVCGPLVMAALANETSDADGDPAPLPVITAICGLSDASGVCGGRPDLVLGLSTGDLWVGRPSSHGGRGADVRVCVGPGCVLSGWELERVGSAVAGDSTPSAAVRHSHPPFCAVSVCLRAQSGARRLILLFFFFFSNPLGHGGGSHGD